MSFVCCIIHIFNSWQVFPISFKTRLTHKICTFLANPCFCRNAWLKDWRFRETSVLFLTTWAHPGFHIVTSPIKHVLVYCSFNFLMDYTKCFYFSIQLSCLYLVSNSTILSIIYCIYEGRCLSNLCFWFNSIFVFDWYSFCWCTSTHYC